MKENFVDSAQSVEERLFIDGQLHYRQIFWINYALGVSDMFE